MTEEYFLNNYITYCDTIYSVSFDDSDDEIHLVQQEDDMEEDLSEIRKEKIAFLKSLNPQVKELYLEYPLFYRDWDDSDRILLYGRSKLYVHEERTKDDKTPIYVGVTDDPNYEYSVRKDAHIIMLDESKGIESVILTEALPGWQAYLYLRCYTYMCVEKQGYLMNSEAIEIMDNLGKRDMVAQQKINRGETFVYKSEFYRTFFPDIYYQEDTFDTVNIDDLSAVYLLHVKNNKLLNWLDKANARVYKTLTKNVKAIIVEGFLEYYKYERFHIQGKKVFSINDVLATIKGLSANNMFGCEPAVKVKVPKYDKENREMLRDFLNQNADVVDKYATELLEEFKATRMLMLALDPFSAKAFTNVHINPSIKGDLKTIVNAIAYSVNGFYEFRDAEDVSKELKKIGLFSEAIEIITKIKGSQLILSELKRIEELDNASN